MEPLKLQNPSPLSPSAILAHLRQNVRPIRLESPKLRCDTPEPCDSSDTSTHNIKILNNETPTPSNTTPRDMLDFPQEKTPETPKKLLGILKDSKKSIFFQANEKISSTPIIDKQALEDRLTKLQNNSLPQSPLKSTRRNSVIRVTGSLESSRPTSKRKNLSVGNSKDFRLSKKGKKVTFSPDTKDYGDLSSEVTPVRVRRPIPPLKNFLKEDLELDSSEVFSPKPMFLNSPIPSAVENKIVPVSVKVLERKAHGSPFNINIRPRVLRDPESPRKGSLNLPNVELISAIKDVTPSGRSCTPKQLQRSENRNPLNLNPIVPAQLKTTEEASSFFSPRTGSLSARNNFNVNLNNIQTQSMKNSMITDRSGSKETPIATEKLKASDFNFYAEILKKNKLGPIDKLYRHNSLQSDPRIKQFTITKKNPSTKSVFNSAEKLGVLNALRPRDIKLDP